MSWAIDLKTTGSINDGGSRLPIGNSIHKIEKISRPVNSQDQSGKEQQVLIETTSEGAGYKIYLNPESGSEQVANIAKKTLVAFWTAAGLTETIKPDRLKKLEGKTVELVVVETTGKKGTKNEGKSFTNIQKVNPASDLEESEEEEEEEEGPNEPENQDEEQKEEAPKLNKKDAPWLKKK